MINGKGLVGKVKTVSDGNAVVMLLSDSEFGVSALAAAPGPAGLASCRSPARRATCCSTSCPQAKKVRTGDTIVTAGTISDRLPSPFPPGC